MRDDWNSDLETEWGGEYVFCRVAGYRIADVEVFGFPRVYAVSDDPVRSGFDLCRSGAFGKSGVSGRGDGHAHFWQCAGTSERAYLLAERKKDTAWIQMEILRIHFIVWRKPISASPFDLPDHWHPVHEMADRKCPSFS